MRTRFIAILAIGSLLTLSQPAHAGWAQRHIHAIAVVGGIAAVGVTGGTGYVIHRDIATMGERLDRFAASDTGRHLESLLANGDRASSNIADLAGNLARMTADKGEVPQLLAATTKLEGILGVTVDKAQPAVANLGALLDPKTGAATQLINRGTALIATMNKQLPGTLAATKSTLIAVRGAVGEAQKAIADVHTLLNDPNISQTVGKLPGAVDAATNALGNLALLTGDFDRRGLGALLGTKHPAAIPAMVVRAPGRS